MSKKVMYLKVGGETHNRIFPLDPVLDCGHRDFHHILVPCLFILSISFDNAVTKFK